MPQLDPTYFASQIFWLTVVFVFLYLVMSRLVLPRIGEVLEERSERIADDLDKAESLKKEAEGVIAAYEEALTKARGEASAVLAQAGQEVADMAAKRQADFARDLADGFSVMDRGSIVLSGDMAGADEARIKALLTV